MQSQSILTRIKPHLVWILAAIVLLSANGIILSKEHIMRNGRLVFLELGTRDPLSLMQGYYMVLRYSTLQEFYWKNRSSDNVIPAKGRLILNIDKNGVATVGSYYNGYEKLGANQQLLKYQINKQRINIGAESYFFQQGTAEVFGAARYGALRINSNGETVLVGLYDKDKKLLQPKARKATKTASR